MKPIFLRLREATGRLFIRLGVTLAKTNKGLVRRIMVDAGVIPDVWNSEAIRRIQRQAWIKCDTRITQRDAIHIWMDYPIMMDAGAFYDDLYNRGLLSKDNYPE